MSKILAAVHELNPEELTVLRTEIETLQTSHINHGVSDHQWANVKKTLQLMKEGKMKTRAAYEVLPELMRKYI